ncbi:hypothetical protein [Cellulosimicrobium protaetiae]|uniref:Uncharacterized protein n=1 Tax=Cellulosimicrobium protaetiae TaxID=2587808 RepID=A0A6M5UJP0_9MICO|nr:hypothetical protein [Cellulosimicrobium protaetiae]QJW36899.1 hypothetical protein FIC82_012595 [Cellulosimicrobium protaetiae]
MPDLRPAHDVLPLGPAPRPATAAELLARLRPALLDALGPTVEGSERVRLDADLDGPDVARLDVDLTGVHVRVGSAQHEAGHGGAADATDPATRDVEDVRSREDAELRRLRLDAHPLLVEDVPVDVDAEVAGLRFRWVEDTAGALGVEPVEPDDAAPVSGHVRVAAPRDALVATARRLVATELESIGLTLASLDVELASAGPRSVSLRGFARVRKGILSASVRAAGTAEVDAHMVLTVRDLELSSRNPVVAALLLAARGELAKAEGHRVDLASDLPPGVRLADVRVEVGETLAVTARLA